MSARCFLILLDQEWREFRRSPALWVMVALPVALSFLVVRSVAGGARPYVAVPMWVLFAQVMVGLMVTTTSLLEGREGKTVEALVVSPASYRDVAAAKAAFALLVSLVAQAVSLAVNGGWVGDIGGILAAVVLGGLVFMLVGLLLGLCAETARTGSALAAALMAALFLSGALFEAFGPLKPVLRYLPGVQSVKLAAQAMAGGPLGVADLLGLLAWVAVLALAAEARIRAEMKR